MTGGKESATVPASRFARIAERLQIPGTPARRLAALAIIAQVAPSLGLLGAVIGFILSRHGQTA